MVVLLFHSETKLRYLHMLHLIIYSEGHCTDFHWYKGKSQKVLFSVIFYRVFLLHKSELPDMKIIWNATIYIRIYAS